jgi:Txe/YoeB family toxin of Txe-Axe toxin-antitoxin module
MTCQEFKDLTNERSPLACTRGERMSWGIHKKACRACRDWHEGVCKGAPEPLKALVEGVFADRVREQHRQDQEDPEWKV